MSAVRGLAAVVAAIVLGLPGPGDAAYYAFSLQEAGTQLQAGSASRTPPPPSGSRS